MSEPNKDFFDLLNSVSNTETFNLALTDNKEYVFKQISTSHLKELIKTVVDSPLTQVIFNNTVSKIMKDTLVTKGVDLSQFNVIDRLLFVLQTRIQSISSTITLLNEENVARIDLNKYKNTLAESFLNDPKLVELQRVEASGIEITYGLPLVNTELQLNEELYKDAIISVDSQEELRKLLGETFINEIAKTIRTISIQDKILELSTIPFKSRVEAVGKLPASLINSVIEYIETYKKVVESCLQIELGTSIPIDGTLFSMR
jgi:hypothetical protein